MSKAKREGALNCSALFQDSQDVRPGFVNALSESLWGS
jgi:hypothetical protein